MLLATRRESTWVARALSLPVVVGIGALSYSIYLWHWPLIVIARLHAEFYGYNPLRGALIGVAASALFAVVAYVAVERPLRRRGPGRHRRLWVIAVGFVVAVVGCLALALSSPNVDPYDHWDPVEYHGKSYDVKPFDIRASAASPRLFDVVFSQKVDDKETWREGGIQHLWGGGAPEVVVLGSSHALMLGKVLDEVCRERRLSVAFLTADNTAVLPDPADAEYYAVRRASLAQWKPKIAVLVERWDGVPGTAEELERNLRELIREISPHAQRLLIFSQVPALEIGDANLREFAAAQMGRQGPLPRIPPDGNEGKRQAAWKVIRKLAQEFPQVTAVNLGEGFYLPDGSVRYADGRQIFYIDDDHLSQAGAEQLRAKLAEVIR